MAFDDEVAPRRRGMTPIRVTLAAGVPQRFGVDGDWVACITAPAGVADLTARFDNSEPVPLPEGLGFRRYYRDVELESATGGAFVILVGFGSVADARATVNANIATTVAYGNTLNNDGDVTCAAGAATLLHGADADRLYTIINNPSTNTVSFRIGRNTVTAASGVLLEPGETITVGGTMAIYAWNLGAGAADLNMLFVKQV